MSSAPKRVTECSKRAGGDGERQGMGGPPELGPIDAGGTLLRSAGSRRSPGTTAPDRKTLFEVESGAPGEKNQRQGRRRVNAKPVAEPGRGRKRQARDQCQAFQDVQ